MLARTELIHQLQQKITVNNATQERQRQRSISQMALLVVIWLC